MNDGRLLLLYGRREDRVNDGRLLLLYGRREGGRIVGVTEGGCCCRDRERIV